MHTLSVSALNEQIKGLLETSFSRVFVEGELSRITFHNSGHIYFTLKDKNSAISCVMFRGNASKLKFNLEEGLKVIIDGGITLYKPRGSYQINCFSIEPSGQGALALAYEQLKEKLSSKGYFDITTKKQLPKYPSKIALITSATSAGLQDMLRVANKRYRAIEIDIYDVLVQGEKSAYDIVNAIKSSDTKGYDFIVLSRGGGSVEDLWSFNEEIVADAIFKAKTPIVSAVGHEIDWVISDFVADLRSPTPSAAMEMTLPDTDELYQFIDSISNQFSQILEQKIVSKEQDIKHLKALYAQNSLSQKIEQKLQEIDSLKKSFTFTIDSKLNRVKQELSNIEMVLKSNHPNTKIKKGFAQISKNSKVIDIQHLKTGDQFSLQSDVVFIEAKVLNLKNLDIITSR